MSHSQVLICASVSFDLPVLHQVCPSIGLPLVTRILCNFTPDEFCPDPVPGMVLEELNSEVYFRFARMVYFSFDLEESCVTYMSN
jgi:hypothetical protein